VIIWWPGITGVYVTLQLPLLSVQDALVKDPVLLLENVTMPVGVIAPVPEESETVTVQVVACPVLTPAGAHATLVPEVLLVEARVKVPLLPLCTLSPPKLPVMSA
jgi:hypothetical protein